MAIVPASAPGGGDVIIVWTTQIMHLQISICICARAASWSWILCVGTILAFSLLSGTAISFPFVPCVRRTWRYRTQQIFFRDGRVSPLECYSRVRSCWSKKIIGPLMIDFLNFCSISRECPKNRVRRCRVAIGNSLPVSENPVRYLASPKSTEPSHL